MNSSSSIGNCYSFSPMTYSTSAVPTTTPTESRRRQLPWLILASESTVNRFYTNLVWSRSCYRGLITDVVLSSSPMDDDCIAVVIYGVEDKLAFCIRSKRPNCWIPLDSPFIQYDQIVYHSGKKLFYTLTTRGWDIELEAWDPHSDTINRFHIEDQSQLLREIHDWPLCFLKHRDLSDSLDEVDSPYCYKRIHLVYDLQSQELFIVKRHLLRNVDGVPHISDRDLITHKTMTFDVFKVDFINDHLVKVQNLEDSIGNRAFFVGKRRGFVLSTTKFPELRFGSIYFADNSAPHVWAFLTTKKMALSAR
ncbi:hypothetical protein RDI58_030579 [Solanum bulbocastanum]|uniref:KIB1-4 beta-propeller domain-containing protein n=1 Tax=Solanum bulbocastanum TaxID=147425 RepID=A0AAN8SRD4_SOLBU